jgi:hypothetical protein
MNNTQSFTCDSSNEDPYKSYKGFKFIFAINLISKPGENIWSVPNRRFMLNSLQSQKLMGQYITSNWYSKSYNKGQSLRFAILMVQNDCAIAKVEKDLNSLGNPFPTLFDIPPYVKKCSFFDMTPLLLDNCINCSFYSGDFTFTMRAINCKWDLLRLNIYKNSQDTCTISHPEFEIFKPF